MAQELLLQPDAAVFRPSDATLAQELDRICRNSIESQRWDVGDVFYVGSVTREGSRADKIITGLAIPTTGTPRFLGVNGSAPAWRTLAVSGGYLTLTDAASGGAVTIGLSAASLAHNLLSATHGDTTADAVVRGDVITGQGATPKWARLAKGAAGALFHAGANEPEWATTLTGVYTMSALGTALTITNDLRVSNSVGIGVAAPAVSSALSIGAHGRAIEANDVAWGSGLLTSNVFWDDSTGDFFILSSLANRPAFFMDSRQVNARRYVFYIDPAGDWNIQDNTAALGRFKIATTGATTIVQWLNLGTTALATAQGSLSVGLTGAAQLSYINADNLLSWYRTSTGAKNMAFGPLAADNNYWGCGVEAGMTTITAGTGGNFAWLVQASTGNLFLNGRETTSFIRLEINDSIQCIDITNTGVVINEASNTAVDFRVESNDDEKMFFIDSSANACGFRVAAPVFVIDMGQAVLSGTQATVIRGGLAVTTASQAALTYDIYNLAAHTVTLTGTTGMTAACAVAGLRLGIITVTDASAITVDNGATLYIAGAVAQTGSAVITNKYALFVDAGTTRLDGDLDHRGTNIGFHGVTPGGQQVYTPSNDATSRSFDVNTVTTLQLANVVATMIRDSHGLYGV